MENQKRGFWDFAGEVYRGIAYGARILANAARTVYYHSTEIGKLEKKLRQEKQYSEETREELDRIQKELEIKRSENTFLQGRMAKEKYQRKGHEQRVVKRMSEMQINFDKVYGKLVSQKQGELEGKDSQIEKLARELDEKLKIISQRSRTISEFNTNFHGDIMNFLSYAFDEVYSMTIGKKRQITHISSSMISLFKAPENLAYLTSKDEKKKTKEELEKEARERIKNLVVGTPYTAFLGENEKERERIREIERGFMEGKLQEAYLKGIHLDLGAEKLKTDLRVIPVYALPQNPFSKVRKSYAGFLLLFPSKLVPWHVLRKRRIRKMEKAFVRTI